MGEEIKEERLHRIMDILREQGQVAVVDLMRRFNVSEVTVRRDLRELAARGMLQRVHGGAIAVASAPPEPPVVQRLVQERSCKELIGRAAAALVADGESVFLGSGSTTTYVARHLMNRKNLTIVTNALNIAVELAAAEGVTVVVTGGVMRAAELSVIGHIAEQSLREVRVDKVIIGAQAISIEAGMTNDCLPLVMTERAIIGMSPRLIVVADHTKFGRIASGYIAPVKRMTTLVTDPETDPEMLTRLKEMQIRVIVAGEEEQKREEEPTIVRFPDR